MILAENKRAKADYQILQTWEAGFTLRGYEVKAVRQQQLSLKESYVTIKINARTKNPEVYLLNCHISPYRPAGPLPHYQPTRSRKLLLHKKEIASICGQIQQKGLTLIPFKVYTKGTKIKVEIALVKGKKQFDKRREIKKRDLDRQVRRQLKNRSD